MEVAAKAGLTVLRLLHICACQKYGTTFLPSVQWFEWMDVIDSLFSIPKWQTDSIIVPKRLSQREGTHINFVSMLVIRVNFMLC